MVTFKAVGHAPAEHSLTPANPREVELGVGQSGLRWHKIETLDRRRRDDLLDVPVMLEEGIIYGMGEFEEFRAQQYEAGISLGIEVDDEHPAVSTCQSGRDVQGARGFPDATLIVDHCDHVLGLWVHIHLIYAFMNHAMLN
jgi:hypothetical protein